MTWYQGIAYANLRDGRGQGAWKRGYRVEAESADVASTLMLEMAEDDARADLEVWVPVVEAEEVEQ